jgi:hypothetical protein
MASNARFRINSPQVTYEIFDDEVVMINLDTGNYYSLGGVGADIWGRLERGAALTEIIEDTVKRYKGDCSEIEEAINDLLDGLRRENLVVPLTDAELEGARRLHGRPVLAHEIINAPFEAPVLQKYTDMQELLLLDPIHEVDEMGWPNITPSSPGEKG